MPTLYAKAAGGAWTSAGTWSATGSGGADSAGPPTANDDVIFEAGSGAVSLGGSPTCRSLNCTSGTGDYANTLTHANAIILNIGTNTAGAGNVLFKFSAGMTYTLGGTTAEIRIASSSGTTHTITTAGKSLARLRFNAGSPTVQLQDNVTMTGAWTHASSNTFDANGKSIAISELSTTFGGNGKTYAAVTLSGGGNAIVTGANTFSSFTYTGNAVKSDSISFSANQTITGTLTISGNSTTNRVLVGTDQLGTSRTLTAATVSMSNVDLQDIAGAGAASWDLSAITGLGGDCGGNSGITFTTPATQHVVNIASLLWSGAARWTSRVPLPQDDVVMDFNFASSTFTLDMPRAGKNITWVGATGSPTWGVSTTTRIFGSLTLISGMTIGSGSTIVFEGRGAQTLTSAGRTFTQIVTASVFGGSLTLQDAFATSSASSSALNVTAGTFDANGFSVTLSGGAFNSSGALTRAITMGSGTWTLGGSNAVSWNLTTTTGLTFNAGTSTILITDTSATAKTFIGGGKTYNNLTCSGGTGGVTIDGSNTFNVLALNAAGATNPYKFTAGTTNTVQSLTSTADASHTASMITDTGAGSFTLSDASGQNSIDYFTITRSTAQGGAAWFAGAHSTDGGSNSGWQFRGPAGGMYQYAMMMQPTGQAC